jgi:hypothetical protein
VKEESEMRKRSMPIIFLAVLLAVGLAPAVPRPGISVCR